MQSGSLATSSFILSNFRHLMNGSNELIEKMGTEDLMIPKFSEEVLINLCDSAIAILKQKNSTLIHITSPSIIIGDLHGNLHDLIRIVNSIIDIFSNNVLFLGDYVDRGQFQLETITLLLALRIEYPNNIFLIRGNHEFINVNEHSGFKNELTEAGYSDQLFEKFNEVFCWLPISAIVNDHIFCVHGGLSQYFHDIQQIEKEFKLPIRDIYYNPNAEKPLTDKTVQRKHRLSDVSDEKIVSQYEKTSLLHANTAQLVSPKHHRFSDAEERKNNIVNLRSSLDSKPPLPSKPFPLQRRTSSDMNTKASQPTNTRYLPVITKMPLPKLMQAPNMNLTNSSDSETLANNSNESAPIQPAVSNPSINVTSINSNPSTPILPAASNPFIKIPLVNNGSPLFNKQNSPHRPIPTLSSSMSYAPNSPNQMIGFSECDDINNIQLLTDIMWSDPTNSCELFLPSNRGSGCYFGFVVTNNFLKKNNMKIIKNGVETTHEKKIITVYSSSSLKQGIFAACVIFSPDDSYKAFRFRPINIVNRKDAKFFAPTLKPAHSYESHNLNTFNLSPNKMINSFKGMRKASKGVIVQQSLDLYQNNANRNELQ